MKKKRLVTLVRSSILALIILALPLMAASANPIQDKPVKIGALIPFTGFLSHPTFKRAIVLALDEAGWKVAGRQIVLIDVDTATNPDKALDKARKLVEVDKVDFLIGPLHGTGTIVVGEYATKVNVPNFTYAMGATYKTLVERGLDKLYLTSGTINAGPYYLAKYMYNELGYRKIVTLATDFQAGHEIMEAAVYGFEESGGKVIQQQWIPFGEMDLAPYVSAIKKADACVIWIAGSAGPVFNVTYKQFDVTMPLLRVDGGEYTWDQQLKKTPVMEGLIAATYYSWAIDNPVNKRYVKAYKEKWGHFPDAHATAAYIDIKIILDVLRETEGDTSPEKFDEVVKKLRFDTPRGPMTFTEDRTIIANIYVMQVQKVNGELVPKIIHTIEGCDTRKGIKMGR